MHAVGAQEEDETLAGPDTLDDLLVPGFARTQAMPLLFELVQLHAERRVAPLEHGGHSHRDVQRIDGGIADEVMEQGAIIRALRRRWRPGQTEPGLRVKQMHVPGVDAEADTLVDGH